jgi:hypothetical protein
MRGLPCGCAAISKSTTPKPTTKKHLSNFGMVAAVQDTNTEPVSDYFKMHAEALIGAINLWEEQVKILRH